jgi:hypothetical protein
MWRFVVLQVHVWNSLVQRGHRRMAPDATDRNEDCSGIDRESNILVQRRWSFHVTVVSLPRHQLAKWGRRRSRRRWRNREPFVSVSQSPEQVKDSASDQRVVVIGFKFVWLELPTMLRLRRTRSTLFRRRCVALPWWRHKKHHRFESFDATATTWFRPRLSWREKSSRWTLSGPHDF